MAQLHLVGIDVSASTLEVAFARPAGGVAPATFANTPAGHRQLIKWLTKRGRSARVCMEATGVYSLAGALALHEHRRTEVMVVNPKAIKHYGEATMKRAKTDPVDAALLLDYLQRMPFVGWQPPSASVLQVQAITRRISQLKVEITRETNRLHADGYRGHLSALIGRDIQVHIRHMKGRIKRLEDEAVALVLADPVLSEKYHHLLSIPGVAQTTALRLIGELAVLADDMSAPQWVAHAGLDPRPYESGGSVHRPRRISKVGNKHLRTALYMPAWVAIQYAPEVNAFYEKLIGAGKKPMQAVVAVMRKLLHAIWGVWTHNQDFDGQKFYKIAA